MFIMYANQIDGGETKQQTNVIGERGGARGTKHSEKTQTIVPLQYNTVQYSTVQYSTVQYSTVQYNTVQYSTVTHIKIPIEPVEPANLIKTNRKNETIFHIARTCHHHRHHRVCVS